MTLKVLGVLFLATGVLATFGAGAGAAQETAEVGSGSTVEDVTTATDSGGDVSADDGFEKCGQDAPEPPAGGGGGDGGDGGSGC